MLTWPSSLAKACKHSSTKHKSSLIWLLFEKKQLGLGTPESLLQAYYFDAGPTQCQVSKESALMKIQQNHLLEESRFHSEVQATSSQVSSASYVNHVEHSVSPKGQYISVDQSHNSTFNNIEYRSN